MEINIDLLFLHNFTIPSSLLSSCFGHRFISWYCVLVTSVHSVTLFFPQIDLMPHDVITQLLRVLAIETKQEKAIINAEAADVALSGLEAFSFDYIVKWPLSLIINR